MNSELKKNNDAKSSASPEKTQNGKKRCIELVQETIVEQNLKTPGKRLRTTTDRISSDSAEKNEDELNPVELENYDENSREAKDEELFSQKTDFSEDFAEVDEDDDGKFKGVPLTELPSSWTNPPKLVDMKDVRDPNHTFLIKPFEFDLNDPERIVEGIHSDGSYMDEWDTDHVRMPCSPMYILRNGTKRWPIIQNRLTELHRLAEAHMATVDDIKRTIEECAGRKYEINGLEEILNEVFSEDDRIHFLSVVLSNICQLALKVDKICGKPPKLLRAGSNRAVTISQHQAASLLSCAFFCLFPRRFNQKVGSEYEEFPNPNFNTLFHAGRSGASSWKLEKLRCVLHYFRRITEKMPNGVITFRRYQLPSSCVPKWLESKNQLCQIHLTKNKTIEDIEGALQIDFANKYIGGGVLGDGCVQEEIRFVICPEMLLSLLICQEIKRNECVFLIGCERFSSYRGYSMSFQFKSDFVDKTPKDNWGRKLCEVVAMDAIAFHRRSDQYEIPNMKRELVKAYTCFRVPAASTNLKWPIATGNWGCGAFNGNKQLKAIIQLIAASEAGRSLVYLTFRDQNLVDSFYEIYQYLQNQKATVQNLCCYLQNYSNVHAKMTLFEYILQTPVSSL